MTKKDIAEASGVLLAAAAEISYRLPNALIIPTDLTRLEDLVGRIMTYYPIDPEKEKEQNQ